MCLHLSVDLVAILITQHRLIPLKFHNFTVCFSPQAHGHCQIGINEVENYPFLTFCPGGETNVYRLTKILYLHNWKELFTKKIHVLIIQLYYVCGKSKSPSKCRWQCCFGRSLIGSWARPRKHKTHLSCSSLTVLTEDGSCSTRVQPQVQDVSRAAQLVKMLPHSFHVQASILTSDAVCELMRFL